MSETRGHLLYSRCTVLVQQCEYVNKKRVEAPEVGNVGHRGGRARRAF